jgi:hypothetical protein
MVSMTEKVRTAIIALTVGVVAYFSGSIAHVSNLPSVKTLLTDDSMSALSAVNPPLHHHHMQSLPNWNQAGMIWVANFITRLS